MMDQKTKGLDTKNADIPAVDAEKKMSEPSQVIAKTDDQKAMEQKEKINQS
jgi:hypothetical protein